MAADSQIPYTYINDAKKIIAISSTMESVERRPHPKDILCHHNFERRIIQEKNNHLTWRGKCLEKKIATFDKKLHDIEEFFELFWASNKC